MAVVNAHLPLLTPRTRLKKSLSHISIAFRHPTPSDGLVAQPMEMGVHSWNPPLTPSERLAYERY
jgi:hypothetical protein